MSTNAATINATINSLPPECLEHILLYLQTNASALSSLLRTSKLFFTIVVPILYSDPFSLCKLSLYMPFSRDKLSKVLLDSATENGSFSVKAFLKAMRGQCGSLDCHGQCERGAKLQAIIDQDQEQSASIVNGEMRTGLSSSPIAGKSSYQMVLGGRRTMARYIGSLTAYDGQHWLAFATACLSQGNYRHLAMKLLVQMQIRIIDHTAERLTTMVLFPRIIRDLIPMAHRLRSLVRLQLAGRFDSDELGYVSAFLSARQRDIGTGHGLQEQDDDRNQNEERGTGKKTTERMRPTNAVRGIEEFALPLITYPNLSSHHLVANKDQFARQIQFQQLDILRSLGQQLVSLDANNCSDFMKISHQIPCYLLKQLETFKYVQGALEGNAEFFLRRCRALQDLHFASFHNDVFSWAVIEKQQKQQQQQLQLQPPMQTTTATSPPTTLQPFSADLVQLRQLRLTVSQWFIGRSMQSITYAFNHSLEYPLLSVYDHRLLRSVLCAHTVARLEATATSDKPFRIDPHTLQMPRLRKFRLLRVNENIIIEPAPFEGCPLLEELSISGKIGVSTASGNFEVLRIPLLKSLELATGTASLYQLKSLQYSPLLETLVLVDSLPTAFPHLGGGDNGGFGDIFSSMYRPLGVSPWTDNGPSDKDPSCRATCFPVPIRVDSTLSRTDSSYRRWTLALYLPSPRPTKPRPGTRR